MFISVTVAFNEEIIFRGTYCAISFDITLIRVHLVS